MDPLFDSVDPLFLAGLFDNEPMNKNELEPVIDPSIFGTHPALKSEEVPDGDALFLSGFMDHIQNSLGCSLGPSFTKKSGNVIDLRRNTIVGASLAVPEKLQKTYPTYQVMEQFCVVVGAGKELGSHNPREFTEEERIHVDRILEKTCPVYGNKTRNPKKNANLTKQRAKAIANGFEFVASFYCKGRNLLKTACSCDVGRDIFRVKGGLVVMEKCAPDANGILLPIKHNDEVHKMYSSKKGYPGKSGPLSLSQMEHIAKRGPKSKTGEQDTFVAAMLHDPTIPCSQKQKDNYRSFKRSVIQFHERNPQYYGGYARQEPMMLELLLEVVEILKDTSDRSNCAPPTGASGDSYYTSANWRNYVWPHIVVMDCDHDPKTGKFTSILLTTTDVYLRVQAAIAMSSGNKVQLEVDYFTPRGLKSTYHVGHVGFSDLSHFYWPLFYQISVSENQEAVYQLLSTTINFIEYISQCQAAESTDMSDQGQIATVNVVLADGGTAILAAINQINNEIKTLSKNEERGLVLRRCFAHVIRMGFTRGGGYRGGKGSLPRYLLEKGVSPKLMTKMMSLIIKFNYLPNAKHHEEAMELFLAEFDEHINEHVRNEYLDPQNPMKLGGRAAGAFQGQVGSNNGGEKRCDVWQNKLKSITKDVKGEGRKNCLYMIEAIAIDTYASFASDGGVKKKCTMKPVYHDDDLGIIRDLSKWVGGPLSSDIVYFICLGHNNEVLHTKNVIGDPNASFDVWIPQKVLHKQLKYMKQHESVELMTESYTVQNMNRGTVAYDPMSNDVRHWAKVLANLNESEKAYFKRNYLLKDLIQDHLGFDIASSKGQPGSTWAYLKRFAQRRPQNVKDSGKRMGTKNNKKTLVKSLRKEKEEKDEKDKHMATTDVPPSDSGVNAEQMLKTWESYEVDVDVDEDADIGTLIDILNTYDKSAFNDQEKETMRMLEKGTEVAYQRQLGDWIGLKIDGKTKTVTCIDERCCFGGTCEYSITLRHCSSTKSPLDVYAQMRHSGGTQWLIMQSELQKKETLPLINLGFH